MKSTQTNRISPLMLAIRAFKSGALDEQAIESMLRRLDRRAQGVGAMKERKQRIRHDEGKQESRPDIRRFGVHVTEVSRETDESGGLRRSAIGAIKVLRFITCASLVEARDHIGSCPKLLPFKLTMEDASALAEGLTKRGYLAFVKSID